MSFSKRDIWRMIKCEIGIDPDDSIAATIEGAAINLNYSAGGGESVVLHVACGAATGGPSAQTVDGKIEQSADGSTSWTDVGDAITQLTGDDEDGESPGINLSTLQKYIRANIVVGFTGGSTPTIPVAATLVIGGRD